jgi:hypothetical protein
MRNPITQIQNPKGFRSAPPGGVKGGLFCWDLGFGFWDFRRNPLKAAAYGH